MKIRKSFFAMAIGATLILTMIDVQPAAAARVMILRPYYGFYGPGWYYPAWQPPYVASIRAGEVKISTHLKDASIYVDGGYAGQTGKLKEFSLRPGNHDIEVRDSDGRMLYHDRVQVLLGKTIDIKLSA